MPCQQSHELQLQERPLLEQAKLLRLERFLRSHGCGQGAMTDSHAHGFITAVVSGPESFETDGWLRLVSDEPVFDDRLQAREILELILELHESIARTPSQPGEFRSLIEYVRAPDGCVACHAQEWCHGFMSAMALWQQPPGPKVTGRLKLLFLTTAPRGAARREPRDHHHIERSALLPQTAEALYCQWHKQESTAAKASTLGH